LATRLQTLITQLSTCGEKRISFSGSMFCAFLPGGCFIFANELHRNWRAPKFELHKYRGKRTSRWWRKLSPALSACSSHCRADSSWAQVGSKSSRSSLREMEGHSVSNNIIVLQTLSANSKDTFQLGTSQACQVTRLARSPLL
jgi:hypothetical protein